MLTSMEKAEKFAALAPPLREIDIAEINGTFTPYIFRRSRTMEIWTTCCRRYATVTTADMMETSPMQNYYAVMAMPHQREPRWVYLDPPQPSVHCPFCGKLAIVKELRYTGKRQNLTEYRRAIILRWYRGALWATGWDCKKLYDSERALAGDPRCKLVGVYRFRPGLAEGISRDWWGDLPFTFIDRQDGPLTRGQWHVHGPFHWRADYGMGYDIVGVDELQKSPFRYCMADEYLHHYGKRLVEYLVACCFYPRQIEMLMKAGMTQVVKDLVERGVKHAAAIDWSKENPSDSFGLTGQELRAFLDTDRNIETLELYKRLKGRVPMDEVSSWISGGLDIREAFHQAKKWNLPPERLIRYFAGQIGCARHSGLGNLREAMWYWRDYIDAAEALGDYPLHHENVLLPRGLGQAHDEATSRHREVLARRQRQQREANERDRLAREAKRMEKAEATYEKRRLELEKKYAFTWDGCLIRVPAGAEEILEEGRQLKHCVGGYAVRHLNGKVTILFMRKEKSPDTPWLTIEMRGNELVQIHGFKNEGQFTAEGRFAPDPREVYREFLDTWMDWLERGSKRDKEGRPKLPRQKGKMTA